MNQPTDSPFNRRGIIIIRQTSFNRQYLTDHDSTNRNHFTDTIIQPTSFNRHHHPTDILLQQPTS
jgi:hypothetical protein